MDAAVTSDDHADRSASGGPDRSVLGETPPSPVLEQLAALLADRHPGQPLLVAFARQLWTQVAEEDLAEWSIEGLYAVTLAHWEVGRTRAPAEALLEGGDPQALFPARPGSRCGWCDHVRSCAEGAAAGPRRRPWEGLADEPADEIAAPEVA